MDRNDLLIHFKIDKGEFFCHGEVSVWEQAQLDDVNCPVLEFSNVTAKRMGENGIAVDYEPTEVNWAGVKYTTEDMITSVMFEYMAGRIRYIDYLCPKLKDVLDFYTKQRVSDMKPGVSAFDNWPLHLLKGGDMVYSLLMITDKAVYYSQYDELLMFLPEGVSERRLILLADNYFATTGFYSSVESIKAGNEQLIYLAPDINLDDYNG